MMERRHRCDYFFKENCLISHLLKVKLTLNMLSVLPTTYTAWMWASMANLGFAMVFGKTSEKKNNFFPGKVSGSLFER